MFCLLKFWLSSGEKVCKSRKTLKDEYLVFKIGVDKAENGPFKVRDRKIDEIQGVEFVKVTYTIRRNIGEMHVGISSLHFYCIFDVARFFVSQRFKDAPR